MLLVQGHKTMVTWNQHSDPGLSEKPCSFRSRCRFQWCTLKWVFLYLYFIFTFQCLYLYFKHCLFFLLSSPRKGWLVMGDHELCLQFSGLTEFWGIFQSHCFKLISLSIYLGLWLVSLVTVTITEEQTAVILFNSTSLFSI